MASSLKKNYVLNLINTIAGMVFPLITFPYVTRILEADGIGIVNFYSSIISYITLIAFLGIPLYGTREIAKVKHDPSLLSKVASEILILQLLLTILGYVIVAVLCLTVPKVQEDLLLFLILSTSILFTTLGADWFFRGTEDFKFITIRGLIIRIIYIPLLFIFVKNKQDLWVYGILTVFVTVGNSIFNFYRLSKYIRLKDIKEASQKPQKHIKGAFNIFLLSVSISLYIQISVIILGFLSSDATVGYYTAATRITTIFAGIVTALQTTLLPRASSLIAHSNSEQLKISFSRILNFIYLLMIPLSMGIIIMAPVIISIICGSDFTPSILTLRILAINFILSILNNFICTGLLLPQGKELIATKSCLIGGIINLIFNFILIPFLAQNGTAITAIITELCVGFFMIYWGYRFIPFKLWEKKYLKYIVSSLLMGAICLFIWQLNEHIAYHITVIPIVGIIVYCSLLWLFKDEMYKELFQLSIKKLNFLRNYK